MTYYFLYGVASVLLAETVALILATDWLKRKKDDYGNS